MDKCTALYSSTVGYGQFVISLPMVPPRPLGVKGIPLWPPLTDQHGNVSDHVQDKSPLIEQLQAR
jgi:hypothetical protein